MKVKKKLVIVDAEPYKPGMEDGYKVCYRNTKPLNNSYIPFTFFVTKEEYNPNIHTIVYPAILTLEGWYNLAPDDYIITGIKGERYPCRKDIFEETYEEVKDEIETCNACDAEYNPKITGDIVNGHPFCQKCLVSMAEESAKIDTLKELLGMTISLCGESKEYFQVIARVNEILDEEGIKL